MAVALCNARHTALPPPPLSLGTRVPRAQMGGGIYAISSVLTLQAALLTDKPNANSRKSIS